MLVTFIKVEFPDKGYKVMNVFCDYLDDYGIDYDLIAYDGKVKVDVYSRDNDMITDIYFNAVEEAFRRSRA